MNKMGNKNKGVIVIFIAVLLLSVVLCYLFATNKISIGNKNLNDQNTSSDKNNNKNENNVKPKDNIKDEKSILYTYESSDNNAAKGDPEILTIYSMDDSKIDFKYHAVWNEKDITGIAKKVDTNKYSYELNSYKIELTINSDFVEVKEYMNNQLNSTVKLFK